MSEAVLVNIIVVILVLAIAGISFQFGYKKGVHEERENNKLKDEPEAL